MSEGEGLDVDDVALGRRARAASAEKLGRALQRLTVLREPVVDVAWQRQRVEEPARVVGEPLEERLCGRDGAAHARGHLEVPQQRLARHRVRRR